MAVIEWVRFFLSAGFLLFGMAIFLLEVFGTYRFHYVLNRMQIAATGDTLGIGLCLIGLMIANGINWATAKLALVIVFLWCASPVSSHMISRLQMFTDKRILDHCHIIMLRRKNAGNAPQDPDGEDSADGCRKDRGGKTEDADI